MEIKPILNKLGQKKLIQENIENYKEFINEFKDLKPEIDEQIVDIINNHCQR